MKAEYDLVLKEDDLVMLFLGLFSRSFMRRSTTYRLPFMKRAQVCVPTIFRELTPAAQASTLDHELVHVQQFQPWYGPWWVILFNFLLPLPILFSGRWFIERRAFLLGIRQEIFEVEQVVDALWTQYGWCWPKPLMRAWFIKHLKEGT